MYDLTHPKETLILREYGLNIQNLVSRIQQVPDKAQRTNYAKALVNIMITVNPSLSHNSASIEKAWQDMFLIADYDLDIDIPEPRPTRPKTNTKNIRIPYPNTHDIPSSHKRYGKNVWVLLQAVKKQKGTIDITSTLIHIAKWILTFHKKNTHIDGLVKYFQDVLGKTLLSDTENLKQQIQALNIPIKTTNYRSKRPLKRKRKVKE